MTDSIIPITCDRASGTKIGLFIWKKLYKSNSERLLSNSDKDIKYMYLLASISMNLEEQNNNYHTCRVILIPEVLFLLSHKNCPYKKYFYDENENKIRDYIRVPNEPFFLKSSTIENKKKKNTWTWLKCIPLINNKHHVIGIDIWTYQWFWGARSNALNPNYANRALQLTIDDLMKFSGIDEYYRILMLNNNELISSSKQDRNMIENYNKFVHHLMNPECESAILIINENSNSNNENIISENIVNDNIFRKNMRLNYVNKFDDLDKNAKEKGKAKEKEIFTHFQNDKNAKEKGKAKEKEIFTHFQNDKNTDIDEDSYTSRSSSVNSLSVNSVNSLNSAKMKSFFQNAKDYVM